MFLNTREHPPRKRKGTFIACPAGSRVQTPPEAPKTQCRRYCPVGILPEKPLMRREMLCAIPPLPPGNGSVSGSDCGRDKLIRAHSRLGWAGKSRGFIGASPNASREV